MDISPDTSVYMLLISGLHLLACSLNDRGGLDRGFEVHNSRLNSLRQRKKWKPEAESN